MASVTKAQSKVLEFIRTFIDFEHHSPSFQEIGDGLGLKSLATVAKHVSHLKDKGLLKSEFNRSRSLELVEPESTEARFVLRGTDHLWDNVEGVYWVREKR